MTNALKRPVLLLVAVLVVAPYLVLEACDTAPPATTADDGSSLHLPTFFDCIRKSDALLISAHRAGPVRGFPENAVETIDRFLDGGPAMIEVDVAQTADGVLVLMHDDNIDRTTTGRGRLSTMTYAALQRVTLVDDDGYDTGFKVPTLTEAIRAAKGRGILGIDFKDATPDQVISVLEEEDAVDEVVLIAYNFDDAYRLRDRAPTAMISVGIRTDRDVDKARDRLGDLNLLIAWTGIRATDPALNSQLMHDGIEVNFGSFRTGDALRGAAADRVYRGHWTAGVDILATDHGDRVRKALPNARPDTCWNARVN